MGSSCRMAPFISYDATASSLLTAYGTSIPASNSSELTLTVPVIVTDFCSFPDGSAPINVDYPGAAATIAFGY